jgi:hypothetical protein
MDSPQPVTYNAVVDVNLMSQAWEDKFRNWAQPPSQTETERAENAEKMVRNAISGSSKLNSKSIKVFRQGSYRNRTNIRRESDVDIGVLCDNSFFYHTPPNTTGQTFGINPASYSYAEFKNDVGEALNNYFGSAAVTRGNKAFDIKETSHHVEADVAAFFEHRRYDANGQYLSGVELRPDSDSTARVINWPEQHYENGNAKNTRTARSYRALVRILKSLRCDMEDGKIASAKPITSFLSECLIWNVPDSAFTHPNYSSDLREALIFLYGQTKADAECQDWGEVSELKYLFRPQQKWTRQQANDFIVSAWNYVGFA